MGIAADTVAGLPDSEFKHRKWETTTHTNIITASYLGDLGAVDTLLAAGYDYFAISDKRMRQTQLGRKTRASEAAAQAAIRHAFYVSITRRGAKLWDSHDTDAPLKGFSGKRLRLYRLNP